MFFNSITYGIFLIVVLSLYYPLAHRWQNRLLIVASYVFYGWWDWRFLTLIAISTIVDYFAGRTIGKSENTTIRRAVLLISLCTNLGILGFFKYFDFFVDSFAELLSVFGFESHPTILAIVLPVGISFYTFQTMAYTIDVYRDRMKPVRNFADFSLYVCFFPQLVAGPIERAQRLLPQIQSPRKVSQKEVSEGCVLILFGLFRKVVIADSAAPFVNRCFENPLEYSSSGLVFGVWLFAIQIYCDFSGYTDIARGTARLLGFDLMVNFRQPYFSTSITDFWRRWHISLSTWLRDYLYIGMGGNRHGEFATYRNLMITMLLGGLWHGAAWTFVVWGGLHGIYLSVHKLMLKGMKVPGKVMNFGVFFLIKLFFVFNLVCLTWVFFRAQSLSNAFEYLGHLCSLTGPIIDWSNPGKVLEPGLAFSLMAGALLILDIPVYRSENHTIVLHAPWYIRSFLYSVAVVALLLFGGDNDIAFIYFQF